MTAAEREIRVGLIGYGTIGRRLVTAVRNMPGFRLNGVAVRRPGPGLDALAAAGIGIYRSTQDWESHMVPTGEMRDLLGDVDIVLDCTTRGVGKTLDHLYRLAGVRVIYQGGEREDLAEADYCYGIGFEAARSARSVRIPSCNTTALVRLATALGGAAGITKMRAVMIRSSTDPDKAFKGTVNDLAITPGRSHHAADARRFLPDIDIVTIAASASVNCGHLASIFLDLRKAVPDERVIEYLARAPRCLVLSGGTGSLHDLRHLGGFGLRNDCPSVLTWKEAITASDTEVCMFAGIHMESIVVPETLDAMQAMTGTASCAASAMAVSDKVLGLRQGMINHERADA